MASPNKGEKLAKYLARCGTGSRRKCEDYIRAGWVMVDDAVILTPETRINPEQCSISLRGKSVSPPKNYRYIILNKPAGVICTSQKGRERGQTVFDLVEVPERLFTIGRLDKDTSGLLILTNDGELTQRLTHPSFQKEKEYIVTTSKIIAKSILDKMKIGVQLDDGESRFVSAAVIANNRVEVVLTEGRNRQIRRTFKALGLSVTRLHRTRVGNLKLTKLPAGKWRDLEPEEVASLKAL